MTVMILERRVYERPQSLFNLVPGSLFFPPQRERERKRERETDPRCGWSRDSTRQTSPQSRYTRSIILFARADQRLSSGCDLSKRNARDLAQFHAVCKNRILSTI